MPERPIFENLDGWLNPPVVQKRVIAYLIQLDAPALLREIYRPLGLPRASVNRVLQRLHNRGLVRRWKIPTEVHLPSKGGGAGAGRSARMCFLYQLTSDMTA